MIRRTVLFSISLMALMALGLLAACGREPARKETAFTPPADGRLTEAQVSRYLSRALKDPAGADGFSPGERDWIRARVQEARLAATAGKLDRRVIESRRSILRSLEERRRTVTDPAAKAETDRRIAEVRRLLAGAPPEPVPSVRYNSELIARLETPENGKTP